MTNSPNHASPDYPRGAYRWPAILVIAAALLSCLAFADWWRAAPPEALQNATYVGRESCVACHQAEHKDWVGSHHDLAMDYATEETVLADFNNTSFERNGVTTRFFRDGNRFMVNAEGPDGELHDYEVKYTFGVTPLQQYMVEMPPDEYGPDGRVQVLRVSWDTEGKRWFEVTPPDVLDERLLPDDPLHWTGVAQNWNTTCAECHSTNLQKNYDLDSHRYDTTWSEIDVSCEECHGPASLHVELANANSLFWDRRHGYGLAKLKGADSTAQIETCAKCHARRNKVHGDFRPGSPLLDSYSPALLDAGLYHADGQILDEVYVYGSFVQSKMHRKGVRCTDCHNPHSLKLKFQGNALCAQCHEPAKYDVAAHHHHPATPDGAGTHCVDCHMPATTYMGVDPRRDHSFRVPRPDLTVKVGTPNACNGCHTEQDKNAEWAAAKVVEWFGEHRHNDPHWAPAIAAGRNGEPQGERLLTELIQREAPAIVKATAVELLSQYPSNAAREEVRSQLEALNPLVRQAAAQSYQATDMNELVRALTPRLQDPRRAVRHEAGRRLAGAPTHAMTGEQIDALNAAITEYRNAQSLQIERAAGHLNLADIASRRGDTQRSIQELRTAIRLEPYLTGPRSQLALELSQAGGDPTEVANLRREETKLLRRDVGFLPDSSPTRYRLGLLLYQLAELEPAEAELAEACRLAPNNYDFRMALALLQERRYELTGDEQHLQAAGDSLKEMERIAPSDPRTNSILQRLLATHAARAEQGNRQLDEPEQ